MRVNIYAEEMTDKVELVSKETKDGMFVGVRFWLALPVTMPNTVRKNIPSERLKAAADILGCSPLELFTELEKPNQVRGPFMHGPDDDDSAAVTFWGKAQLKVALKKALELLEAHGG